MRPFPLDHEENQRPGAVVCGVYKDLCLAVDRYGQMMIPIGIVHISDYISLHISDYISI